MNSTNNYARCELNNNVIENDVLARGLTITLNPKFTSKKRMRNQLKTSFNHLMSLLKGRFSEFICVAELTKNANIHYHLLGYLVDPNEQMYILDILKYQRYAKFFGEQHKFETFQTQGNFDRWREYILKDIEKTYYIINHKAPDNLNVVHHYIKPEEKIIISQIKPELDSDTIEIELGYKKDRLMVSFD